MPDRMPSDILKGKKISIGFDPTLFTKNSLAIFFKNVECVFQPLVKNLVDEIWTRKIKKSTIKFFTLPNRYVSEN